MTNSQTHLSNPNEGQHPESPDVTCREGLPAWRSRRSLLWLLSVAILGLAADLVSKHLTFAHVRRPVELIPGILSLDRSLNFGALFGIGQGMTWVFIAASAAAVVFVAYMFATSRRGQWVVHLALGLVLAGALGNLYDRIFVRVVLVTRAGEEIARGMLVEDNQPEYVRIDPIPSNTSHELTYMLQTRDGQPNGRTILRPTAVRDFIRIDWSLDRQWTEKLPVLRRLFSRQPGTQGSKEADRLMIWPWIFNIADSMLVVGVSLLLIIYWRHPMAPHQEPGKDAPDESASTGKA